MRGKNGIELIKYQKLHYNATTKNVCRKCKVIIKHRQRSQTRFNQMFSSIS